MPIVCTKVPDVPNSSMNSAVELLPSTPEPSPTWSTAKFPAVNEAALAAAASKTNVRVE
jgi:hypothetical protein